MQPYGSGAGIFVHVHYLQFRIIPPKGHYLMVQPDVTDQLSNLYEDTEACAKLIGLQYIRGDEPGYTRRRSGKGFSFLTHDGSVVHDAATKKHLSSFVIPPAWQDIWICNSDAGHLQVTGIDDKGRKQYIYHPKWRVMRDLIKFYRMIVFAQALPKIRRAIDINLERPQLDREKVLSVMLWLLDNTYLRIGNDSYFVENESVGLTTLSDKNLVVAGPVVTLSFKGKSGKQQQVTFEDERIAGIIAELIRVRGDRLFRYATGTSHVAIEAAHINSYLHEITGKPISAKDFRTWGGTLMAFNHLVETCKDNHTPAPKPGKVIVQAVDAAANVLGNTRTVAKSSYIHPDILETFVHDTFGDYYENARQRSARKGLDKRETELANVLEQLFETEFTLLKKSSA